MTKFKTIQYKSKSISKINILGLSKDELYQKLFDLNIHKKELTMRVQQLFSWIHVHGKLNFDEMTNLSKEFRLLMSEHFTITRPKIIKKQISQDGTRK